MRVQGRTQDTGQHGPQGGQTCEATVQVSAHLWPRGPLIGMTGCLSWDEWREEAAPWLGTGDPCDLSLALFPAPRPLSAFAFMRGWQDSHGSPLRRAQETLSRH